MAVPVLNEKGGSHSISATFVVEDEVVALLSPRRTTDNLFPGGKSSLLDERHG